MPTDPIDPYQDAKTGALLNKLSLHDGVDLAARERELTALRIIELREKKFHNFDFHTLQKIHKAIFQDVYGWAGKVRTVNIAKNGTVFCPLENMAYYIDDIFQTLKKDNNLKGLDADAFCKKAATLFCDINMLHPFREGNGRTEREFIYHLAKNAGYKLDLNQADKKRYMFASVYGQLYSCHMEHLMRDMIQPLARKKAPHYNLCVPAHSVQESMKTI